LPFFLGLIQSSRHEAVSRSSLLFAIIRRLLPRWLRILSLKDCMSSPILIKHADIFGFSNFYISHSFKHIKIKTNDLYFEITTLPSKFIYYHNPFSPSRFNLVRRSRLLNVIRENYICIPDFVIFY
jgi:hypothetical protein